MSKADQLGDSASFASVAAPRSTRRRLIDDVTGEAPAQDARTARLADLAHNPYNPRQKLGDLQETADSLLERGQIQPVTVTTRQAFLLAHPGCENELGAARYVVLDGNRRLGAARLAGIEELRIDCNDDLAASAADILESALVANLHREDLTPLEEAEALASLVKVHGSQRQAARRVGKSHVWVSQRLALLDLIPQLQDALRAGDITVEDARQVARLPQNEQAGAVNARKDRRENAAKHAPALDETLVLDNSGNGVSTPALQLVPAGEADMTPAPPAPPDPGPGNSVSRARTARPAAPAYSASLDWDDLAAIAALLRQNLDPGQRQELASLIIAADS